MLVVGGEVWRRATVIASPEPQCRAGQSLLREEGVVQPCTPWTGSISSGTAQGPAPAKNTDKAWCWLQGRKR